VRRGRVAAVVVAVVVAAGCTTDERPRGAPRTGQLPSLVPLLDGEDHAAGVGAIVRTTARTAVLVASPCAGAGLPDRLVVALHEEQLPIVHDERDEVHPVGGQGGRGLAIVDLPRGVHDLRPVGPAAPPRKGDLVRVVATGQGALVVLAATVEESTATEVRLAPLSPSGVADVRAPETRLDGVAGAAVLAEDGGLVGFVTGSREGGQAIVTPVAAIDGLMEAVISAEGPDVLGPDDGAVILRVRVVRLEGLPTIEDEWGAADFTLAISLGDVTLPPIPLWTESRPMLVRARSSGPAVVRLIERDVTLGAGDTGIDLAEPATLDALVPGTTTITFPLTRAVLERHPEARRGSRRTRVTLAVERVDPEARSGPDQTPLGALPCELGRIGSGHLDVAGGDGSDFWFVDGERDRPTPAIVVLLRRDPRARLALAGFPPGFESRLFELEPAPGRWLAVTHADLPPGRTFMRTVALEGVASSYHLLVAPSAAPEGLVRALFRLVARVAEDRLPYLSSREFASEVAVGLTFGAALDPGVISKAVLAELGHRNAEARHLALHLLESHFPPTLEELSEVYQSATDGARALDAGLLVAMQRPNELRTDDVVARAVRDPDPVVKLRALAIALRVEDPRRRARLAQALAESDPSTIVRKALGRADLGP
jgi:hypothetical protein